MLLTSTSCAFAPTSPSKVSNLRQELDWVGRSIRIGATESEASRVKRRCLATHANPVTGERDCQVLTTLTHAFGQKEPTFAVSLRVATPVVIHLGDEVGLI